MSEHTPSSSCPNCTRLSSALQQAQTWQPISSAPKDGTPILIDFGAIGIHRVFWSEQPYRHGIGIWCVTDMKYEDRPLRGYVSPDVRGWMPLPAPPAGDAAPSTPNKS